MTTQADYVRSLFANLESGTNVLVDGDTAAVELESLSTALDGKPFLCPPTFYVSEKIPYYLKFATRK